MTVAPVHFSPNIAPTSSKAFFCAEEPSAFSVPVAHSAPAPEAAEEDAPEEAPAEELDDVLLSEPHAVSARAPARAIVDRPARR